MEQLLYKALIVGFVLDLHKWNVSEELSVTAWKTSSSVAEGDWSSRESPLYSSECEEHNYCFTQSLRSLENI